MAVQVLKNVSNLYLTRYIIYSLVLSIQMLKVPLSTFPLVSVGDAKRIAACASHPDTQGLYYFV